MSTQATVGQRAWHTDVMGMTASIHLRGPDLHGAEVAAAVEEAFAGLRRVDAVFSPYRAGSDLLRVRSGALAAADADPDLADVLALCAEAVTRTEGWFDPVVPGSSGPVLDPTGLVKGWAVQRAGTVLARLPEHDHYVAVAGDISLAVQRRDTPPWRVGITAPGSRTELVAVTGCSTGGVATSGNGEHGGHVRNPFTGRPATELASVTVVGPELLWADVHATAAVARGLDALRWLPTLVDHEWFVVAVDGRRWRSPGWTQV